MAPRVIPNQVPLRHHPPHQRRLHLRPAAHHKKRSLHIVLRQHVQQPWRPLRIRPIVERQRKFFRPFRRSQRRSKNPRPRRKCRIRAPSRRQPQSPGSAQPRINLCSQLSNHPVHQSSAPSPASLCPLPLIAARPNSPSSGRNQSQTSDHPASHQYEWEPPSPFRLSGSTGPVVSAAVPSIRLPSQKP